MTRFDLLSVTLRWLCGCWLLWRVTPVGRSGGGERPDLPLLERPPCSIVIPARDEAGTLPKLLASLAAERGPDDEVIVVDDASTDGTAAVALEGGARVIVAPPLPAGWTGKNSACWTGAHAAAHDVLVFLDADTEVLPDGLDRLLGDQRRHGGMLSVQPFHAVRRAYEQLSAFFNVVAMMGIDAFTPLGEHRRPSGAFGPVLITHRADYDRVGGHASVADQILDDVALARRYTEAGLRVTCLGGKGTVRFRMYPDGPHHLLEGWTKNFAGGAVGTRKLTLLLIVAWISICLEAAWDVAAAPAVASAAVYVAVAGQVAWMLRRIGAFHPLTSVVYPVSLAFFLALFARSIFDVYVRRRVTWKGRQLAT
jgi:4,4'-diaponeurosporenoate glycosyltransferase